MCLSFSVGLSSQPTTFGHRPGRRVVTSWTNHQLPSLISRMVEHPARVVEDLAHADAARGAPGGVTASETGITTTSSLMSVTEVPSS